jgi:GNAT superfamily N-acetyltransferase
VREAHTKSILSEKLSRVLLNNTQGVIGLVNRDYRSHYYPVSSECWIRQANERDRWFRIEQESLGETIGHIAIGGFVLVLFNILKGMVVQSSSLSILMGIFLFNMLVVICKNYPALFSLDLSKYWLIEHRTRGIIGYAKMSRPQKFLCFSQSTHINIFYIAPSFRNQGLGSCLLKHIIRSEAKPIYVLSPRAGRFYQRNGFRDLLRDGGSPVFLIYETEQPSES